jgi:hypothetical protein
MVRDFHSSGFLSSGSSDGYLDDADDDPRTGLVNLADVMLVFACGLMLALVSYWNLDLPSVQELSSKSLQALDTNDVENVTNEVHSTANAYTELGTVYQDPSTGKLYVVTGGDTATDTSGASSTETSTNMTESAVNTNTAQSTSNASSTQSNIISSRAAGAD